MLEVPREREVKPETGQLFLEHYPKEIAGADTLTMFFGSLAHQK
jgi:hypothetical protein